MKIDKQINMGNGEYAMAQCYHLHQQLDKALNLLSGIQQARGEDTSEHEHEIEKYVNEIIVGLTGNKKNYPPTTSFPPTQRIKEDTYKSWDNLDIDSEFNGG